MNLQAIYELDKARREKLQQIQIDVQRRPTAQEGAMVLEVGVEPT